jgi:hypothetical protein
MSRTTLEFLRGAALVIAALALVVLFGLYLT